MDFRTTVSPATLTVERRSEGMAVRYLDGREAIYRRPPETVESPHTTPPGKHVHVLVTDPDITQGSMLYVNDRDTHDDVLESTGVGRIFLDPGEEETLLAGLTIGVEGHAVVVEVDHDVLNRRVFVYAEDEFSEHAYEIVN